MGGKCVYGIQVTLTSATTAYNLWTLLKAIDATIPPYGQQVVIQYDPANSGFLFIGEASISASKYGLKLPATGSLNLSASTNSIQIDGIYLLTDTAGTLVNVISNVN